MADFYTQNTTEERDNAPFPIEAISLFNADEVKNSIEAEKELGSTIKKNDEIEAEWMRKASRVGGRRKAPIFPDIAPPTAPVLTASNVTSTAVDLDWVGATDDVGVVSYDIWKDGVEFITVFTDGYQVTGLIPSTAYAFQVLARDEAGNVSVLSNTESVTTLV